MEAKHHHEISEVGEGVLKSTLEKGNPGKKFRLGAFYLGNWITDVSQIVDPVAYRNFSHQVTLPDINAIFDKFIHDAPSWIKGPIESYGPLKELREKIEKARTQLLTYVKDTLAAGKNGDLAKAAKEAFKYIGYGKFVAPEGSGKEPRMDYPSYLDVFDKLFDQYYPYMHLDRPEVSKGHYADKEASGPRNKHTRPGQVCQGELYDYLRENIQIASSRFAYLDAGVPDVSDRASWAAATFNPARTHFVDQFGAAQRVDDTNPSWNYHLALLGHGLHAVEDFFAHSTFVEHASIALPGTYKRIQRAEDGEILVRRLKKWEYGYKEAKWKELPVDASVVTGYFDFTDTILSVAHLGEEIFGVNRDRAGKKIDDVLEYDYQRLLRDTLDLVSDPKGVMGKNDPKGKDYDKDNANRAAEWLYGKYDEKVGKDIALLKDGDEKIFRYVETLLESPLLKDKPPEVKQAFLDAAKLFGQVKGGVHLYKSLKKVIEFVEEPWLFLKDVLKDTVVETLVDQLKAYVADHVEQMIGSRRIGCHSLIAKDGGPELFYDAGMECAQAVHWYVVATLARHGRRRKLEICRTPEGMNHSNSVYCSSWIDWLELVEYYLAHPLANVSVVEVPREVEGSIIHITAAEKQSAMSPDSLKSLGDKYRPTAVVLEPATGEVRYLKNEFSWETIADANFPTKGMSTEQRKRQINKILAHQPDQAMIVSDGINYAFRPGYRLIIPHQRIQAPEVKSDAVQRRWWYPVISTGHKVIQTWYAEDGSVTCAAPAEAHHPIPIPHKELLKLIDDSETLRKKLERDYNAL